MEQILIFLFTVLFAIRVLVVCASKLNSDTDLLICVSKHGSNDKGCSVSGRCCSSMSVLVKDLNNNCQILSYLPEVSIELKSDLNLTNTVQFGNICGKALPLQIKGNHFFISCSNEIPEVKKDSGSGLYFNTIQSLSLLDMTFLNCGSLQSSTSQNVSNISTTYLFPTTLYLLNCSNVSLSNISICNGHGTAIAMFDAVGEIKISDCYFENNRIRSRSPLLDYPGGGGLYIEFTNCTPGQTGNCHHSKALSSSYMIKNCWFKNNSASLLSIGNTSYLLLKGKFEGMGKGGGMVIFINGNNGHCSIQVVNCTFLNNSAVFGGGLMVQFKDRPSNNVVSVENCNFTENKAYSYGGGGVCGGFIINKVNTVNNTMNFIGCVFENNSARGNGGGMSLFATRGTSSNSNGVNNIHLVKCLWKKNSAFVASALDLAPEVYSRLGSGPLPIPIIENCTFDSNFNTGNNVSIRKNDNFNASENGLATVYISGFTVDFKEDIFFLNNNGTALYLSLASVSVKNGSNLHFEGNYGKHGGGIFMAAFSVLFIKDNCSLRFVNNTSATKGGAILVQSLDYQHEAHFSHSCFVQFQRNPEKFPFVFENNTAKSGVGNALFATSRFPCEEYKDLFESIRQKNDTKAVAFPASKFYLNSSDLGPIVPGVEVHLNITAVDEFNNSQNVMYGGFIVSPSGNLTIDPAYMQVSNNTIKFHGNSPGSTGILTLETETATLTINVSLSECPPGFHNDGESCVCTISTFEGIAKCEKTNSYIVRGFWIGRCNQDEICTAHCPPGYCSYNDSRLELLKLPSNLNDLNEFLCDRYRTGILCHKCKNGTSVYYHSHSYRCYLNRYCSLGIIIYLLSEIIPLTIFFLVVTVFNINLTSGTMNGFVLFAQIADTIDVTAQGSIEFPETAKKLSLPYKLIYRMFNFDFFSLESLSFCLWESATALDMMAIKYVTITFALCLVLLTILFLNSWKCKMFCVWFRPRSLRTALTHSLATLVIICFSQCARICFSILSYSKLSYSDHQEAIVFYDGVMQPFRMGHVKYAIPAIFFLTLLVFVPLVWLTLYPLLFSVLGKCHLSESTISMFLSKFFPIGLIDLFQGSFKDNRRCFAGFYFLYRLIPLILTIKFTNRTYFYTLTSVQYLGMLAFHFVFQPYKNPSYNLIDSFIFTNLMLINLLSAHNYGMISSECIYSSSNNAAAVYVQLLLMYLPMTYILLLCSNKVYKRAKQCCKGYLKMDENSEDLPELRDVPDSDGANSMTL